MKNLDLLPTQNAKENQMQTELEKRIKNNILQIRAIENKIIVFERTKQKFQKLNQLQRDAFLKFSNQIGKKFQEITGGGGSVEFLSGTKNDNSPHTILKEQKYEILKGTSERPEEIRIIETGNVEQIETFFATAIFKYKNYRHERNFVFQEKKKNEWSDEIEGVSAKLLLWGTNRYVSDPAKISYDVVNIINEKIRTESAKNLAKLGIEFAQSQLQEWNRSMPNEWNFSVEDSKLYLKHPQFWRKELCFKFDGGEFLIKMETGFKTSYVQVDKFIKILQILDSGK